MRLTILRNSDQNLARMAEMRIVKRHMNILIYSCPDFIQDNQVINNTKYRGEIVC